MESRHCRSTTGLCFVINKGTITLRDEKNTFNVVCGIARKMVLQIDDLGTRR